MSIFFEVIKNDDLEIIEVSKRIKSEIINKNSSQSIIEPSSMTSNNNSNHSLSTTTNVDSFSNDNNNNNNNNINTNNDNKNEDANLFNSIKLNNVVEAIGAFILPINGFMNEAFENVLNEYKLFDKLK
jgi:hypothetical protein